MIIAAAARLVSGRQDLTLLVITSCTFILMLLSNMLQTGLAALCLAFCFMSSVASALMNGNQYASDLSYPLTENPAIRRPYRMKFHRALADSINFS
jgi:hypothetical protein